MYPFTCSLQLTVVSSKSPSPMCRQAVYHLQSSNQKQHWWVWREWRQGNGSVELFYEECWCSMISFVCIQSLSPGPALASPRAPEHAIEATLALDYGHFLLPVLRLTIFLLDINTFPQCCYKAMQMWRLKPPADLPSSCLPEMATGRLVWCLESFSPLFSHNLLIVFSCR